MSNTEKRESVYWTCNRHNERLSCTNIKDAIREAIDDYEYEGDVPKDIQVFGYARKHLPTPESLAESAYDYLLESLDVEFGDPDEFNQYGRRSENVMLLMTAACEALCTDYVPFMCEEVERKMVRVEDYI